jgi:predicted GNAT superfamily acetyltransferase
MASIDIVALRALDSLGVAVDLQKIYWGGTSDSLVPLHMLFSIVTSGGHVLAAMDGDRAVGVLIGLMATVAAPDQPVTPDLLAIASKRMVVLPEYRGQRIGEQLKWAQAELAMAQGINRVTWTFDPLLTPNAHLNIRKLGGVGAKFYRDYYGTDESTGLPSLGASDRLMLVWRLDSPRVQAARAGGGQRHMLDDYLADGAVFINPSRQQGDDVVPAEMITEADDDAVVLVEVPDNYTTLEQAQPDLARAWRAHSRLTLEHMMKRGCEAVDFVRGDYAGRGRTCYVLMRQPRS